MSVILGLDLGTRTLGMAISDPMGIIASGIENFRFEEADYQKAIKRVEEVVKQYNVEKIVMGLPLHMNGNKGDKVELVTWFKEELEKVISTPISLLDERWTTKMATRRLLEADLSRKKRKQVIDMMSAVIILQNYLDMGGK